MPQYNSSFFHSPSFCVLPGTGQNLTTGTTLYKNTKPFLLCDCSSLSRLTDIGHSQTTPKEQTVLDTGQKTNTEGLLVHGFGLWVPRFEYLISELKTRIQTDFSQVTNIQYKTAAMKNNEIRHPGSDWVLVHLSNDMDPLCSVCKPQAIIFKKLHLCLRKPKRVSWKSVKFLYIKLWVSNESFVLLQTWNPFPDQKIGANGVSVPIST